MHKQNQRGSALIMLFIALALFGVLAFAFMQGSRSNLTMMTTEKQKAVATQFQDCENTVQLTMKRLIAKGCRADLISTNPDGSAVVGGAADGSCSLFHNNGGTLRACGNYDTTCMLDLLPGESCAGVIYIGEYNGDRLYTRPYDQGDSSWNNGGGVHTATPAGDLQDGMANTNILVGLADAGAPYGAAILCRALGPAWFLPARHQLLWLGNNQNLGDLAGTIDTGTAYWSSSQRDTNRAELVDMNMPVSQGAFWKADVVHVRCMRGDP